MLRGAKIRGAERGGADFVAPSLGGEREGVLRAPRGRGRTSGVAADDREHLRAVIVELLRADALDPSESGEVARFRLDYEIERLVVEDDVRGLPDLLRLDPSPSL